MGVKEKAIAKARLHAPYLNESLSLYPGLGPLFLADEPVNILDGLMGVLPDHVQELETEMALLRHLKRQAHLIIALSDIAGVWDWVMVTEYLTRLADLSVKRLLTASARQVGADGTQDNPVPGVFVLAVGKMGARELNYSSDIDFNVFYDPLKVQVPNPARAERTLIKLVQGLIKGLESITEDGYVFRTDLRLRPDPRSNAVAVSTVTAERYYETIGQNWERAAMIKARVCAGDQQVGQAFIEDVLKPFIWRRHLDYAAIDDILAIKRQIHARIGDDAISIVGHHLKLGVGGIREIEFYAQVQQLLLGGRNRSLQCLRTLEALIALRDGGYIKTEDCHILCMHYARLRKLEHAAQMMGDVQTHIVPVDEKQRYDFSLLSGYDTTEAMAEDLGQILKDVRRIYTELFPEMESLSSREGNMVFTGVEPDPETLQTLKRLNFQEPVEIWQDMAAWLGGRIRATRAERSRELLTALAPKIIEFCSDTGMADKAFGLFKQFFISLNSGVSLLSMFNQRPEHLRDIIGLMTQSPIIADVIADKPRILDALSDPDFLKIDRHYMDANDLILSHCEDFEAALNGSRRWVREERFRIIAAFLMGRLELKDLGSLFTILAERTISALLPFAIKEAELREGPIQGNIGIIGLGKLGGRAMTLKSDLDIMLIYEATDGQMNAQQSYTRVTQRLISALSAVTEEGGLFEVDMALRPSGRSGPVAVSLEAFLRYYQEKAWSWEFMALSRSRVVAANSDIFVQRLENMRLQALLSERVDLDFSKDIADMLKRLRREKIARHSWDLKNMAGGIRDVEFIAQKNILMDRTQLANLSLDIVQLLEHLDLNELSEAYQNYLLYAQAKSIYYGAIDNGDESLEPIAELMNFSSVEELKTRFANYKSVVSTHVEDYIFE